MVCGIRIKNASGTIQVDETYRNLALKTIASVNTSPAYSGSTYSIASFTISGETPVVAIRCSVAAVIEFSDKSGSNWTYYLRANSPTAVSITYYVFDTITTYPNDRFGLRVFDAAGRPVFHSSMKYMRVVDAISGKSSAYGTRTYTAGRLYAWVSCGTEMYQKVNGSRLEYCITGAAIASGGITIGKIVLSSIAGSGGAEPYPFSGIVLDVTNY